MRKAVMALAILNAVAVILVIALCMPATVATHFNYRGEADAWGSKWTYAMFAVLPLILEIVYEIYRRRTANKAGNRKLEDKLIPVIAVFFICIGWIMIPLNGGDSMNLTGGCVLFILFGVLMMFISNYMGKVKHNRHLGLRVPWTLKSEAVWKKAHRLSGFTGTAGGFLLVLSGVIGLFNKENAFLWGMIGTFIAIMLVVVIPSVYSWLLYRKLHGKPTR